MLISVIVLMEIFFRFVFGLWIGVLCVCRFVLCEVVEWVGVDE